jgi:PIN domain
MSTGPSKIKPKKLVLFPDTNIFIEARDLKQLPWDELATDEITLLVCAAVRKEVDEHKTSDKNRVRKRALQWNPEFRKLLRPRAVPLLLRENSPRVSVLLAPPNPPGPSHSSLDLHEPDDQLVDATLKYRASHQTEDVRLFTHDTGPIGKAYETGLEHVELPPNWLRDSGPSDEQKEIESLRRKLKLHEENCPTPSIRFLNERGQEIDCVKLTVRRCRSLLSSEVESLLTELKSQDPPPTAEQLKAQESGALGQFMSGYDWRPPSDESIAKFLDEEYPAWLNQVEQVLFHLGFDLGIESSITSFCIAWKNVGARPAESAKLTVKVGGNFSFLKKDVEPTSLFKAIQIPPHPTPPTGKLVHPMAESLEWASRAWEQTAELARLGPINTLSPGIFDLPIQRRHNENAWYVEEERGESSYTQEKIFTCDEWRHQEDPFQQVFSLKFASNQSANSDNIVTVVFHARNLPEPVKEILKVEATIEHHDVVEYARKLLRLD